MFANRSVRRVGGGWLQIAAGADERLVVERPCWHVGEGVSALLVVAPDTSQCGEGVPEPMPPRRPFRRNCSHPSVSATDEMRLVALPNR